MKTNSSIIGIEVGGLSAHAVCEGVHEIPELLQHVFQARQRVEEKGEGVEVEGSRESEGYELMNQLWLAAGRGGVAAHVQNYRSAQVLVGHPPSQSSSGKALENALKGKARMTWQCHPL